MTDKQAYFKWHQVRCINIFQNFTSTDYYKIDFKFMKFDKEADQHSFYNDKPLRIERWSGGYYLYVAGNSEYVNIFRNIDEVNGFIKCLYNKYFKKY